MIWSALIVGIICVILGLIGTIVAIGEDWKYVVIGVMLIITGIATILYAIPTDNYTDWEQEPESGVVLLVKDDQYVVDNGNEYLIKVKQYTENGERDEKYKIIEKNENTFVEFVEIEENETASYSVFTRQNKSVIGIPTETTQTKYVFYIP